MPQVNKIKIRRGLNANIPAPNTEVGELRYSTDSKELYIDDGSSNVKIGGNPTDFPVSTAQQTALNAKANASDTVNLTGNQTVAGVKTFSSSPIVPTATTTTQAVNKAQMDTADAAHVAATDPHTQYMNSDRGDARYAGQPYAVMAKSQFASLSSSYGILGRIFGNDGYINDLQVYGLSTQAGTPTPDVPVPIVSTTGNVTVKSAGVNLIPENLAVIATQSNDGITIARNANGTYSVTGTKATTAFSTFTSNALAVSDRVLLKSGVTYTSSVAGNFGVTISTLKASTGTFHANYSGVFTPSENVYVFQIYWATNVAGVTNATVYPSLVVGTSAITPNLFQRYIGSTQTLPLGTTQLRSLPNGVSDRIYKDGSTWKLEQNVGTVTINGSENWIVDTGFDGTDGSKRYKLAEVPLYMRNITTVAGLTNMMTERFTLNVNKLDGVISANWGAGAFRLLFINTLTYTTLSSFKSWLAAAPFSVIIGLETPVTTTITDPTLITALENIRTYQGVTNITASTPLSGSYGQDVALTYATKTEVASADALKVSKAGDTMTGTLTSTVVGLPYTHTRSSQTRSWGVASDGLFTIYNDTSSSSLLKVLPNGISLGSTTNPNIITGTGFPNGVVSAPVGSIYIDTAITNGASSWIKKSGTGNTGWEVLEGDTGWRNITQYIPAGNTTGGILKIRRINSRVFIQAVNLYLIDGNVVLVEDINATLGSSFNAPENTVAIISVSTSTIAINNALQISRASTTSGILHLGSKATRYWATAYEAIAAWPTTLP